MTEPRYLSYAVTARIYGPGAAMTSARDPFSYLDLPEDKAMVQLRVRSGQFRPDVALDVLDKLDPRCDICAELPVYVAPGMTDDDIVVHALEQFGRLYRER